MHSKFCVPLMWPAILQAQSDTMRVQWITYSVRFHMQNNFWLNLPNNLYFSKLFNHIHWNIIANTYDVFSKNGKCRKVQIISFRWSQLPFSKTFSNKVLPKWLHCIRVMKWQTFDSTVFWSNNSTFISWKIFSVSQSRCWLNKTAIN